MHKVAQVILSVLFALWLIGVSFMVVLLSPVTHNLANATVNDEVSVYDHATLVQYADEGRAYVLGDDDISVPIGADEHTSWSEDVVSHMLDVRAVLLGAEVVTLILTVVVIGWLLMLVRRGKAKELGSVFFVGGVIPLVLALVLGLVGALNFRALFSALHKLLFVDGTWTFSYDSLLICTYPTQFWVGMGIVWVVALVFLSVFFLVLGFRLKRSKELLLRRAPLQRSSRHFSRG